MKLIIDGKVYYVEMHGIEALDEQKEQYQLTCLMPRYLEEMEAIEGDVVAKIQAAISALLPEDTSCVAVEKNEGEALDQYGLSCNAYPVTITCLSYQAKIVKELLAEQLQDRIRTRLKYASKYSVLQCHLVDKENQIKKFKERKRSLESVSRHESDKQKNERQKSKHALKEYVSGCVEEVLENELMQEIADALEVCGDQGHALRLATNHYKKFCYDQQLSTWQRIKPYLLDTTFWGIIGFLAGAILFSLLLNMTIVLFLSPPLVLGILGVILLITSPFWMGSVVGFFSAVLAYGMSMKETNRQHSIRNEFIDYVEKRCESLEKIKQKEATRFVCYRAEENEKLKEPKTEKPKPILAVKKAQKFFKERNPATFSEQMQLQPDGTDGRSWAPSPITRFWR